jgi:hypothetical protein
MARCAVPDRVQRPERMLALRPNSRQNATATGCPHRKRSGQKNSVECELSFSVSILLQRKGDPVTRIWQNAGADFCGPGAGRQNIGPARNFAAG